MQHLPILKICSCPCQAGPKGRRRFFKVSRNQSRSQLGKVLAFTLETMPMAAYKVMTEEPP